MTKAKSATAKDESKSAPKAKASKPKLCPECGAKIAAGQETCVGPGPDGRTHNAAPYTVGEDEATNIAESEG